jgi:hypothetical protein
MEDFRTIISNTEDCWSGHVLSIMDGCWTMYQRLYQIWRTADYPRLYPLWKNAELPDVVSSIQQLYQHGGCWTTYISYVSMEAAELHEVASIMEDCWTTYIQLYQYWGLLNNLRLYPVWRTTELRKVVSRLRTADLYQLWRTSELQYLKLYPVLRTAELAKVVCFHDCWALSSKLHIISQEVCWTNWGYI